MKGEVPQAPVPLGCDIVLWCLCKSVCVCVYDCVSLLLTDLESGHDHRHPAGPNPHLPIEAMHSLSPSL